MERFGHSSINIPSMTKVNNSSLDQYAEDHDLMIREDIEISELEERLKELRERRRQRNKGKQMIDSDLKRRESRCNEEILKNMEELREVCNAQGYAYGIILGNSDVITISSDSLRDWWKNDVHFDCYAPSAAGEYRLMQKISSHKYETSLVSSATALMEIQDKTLASLISALIPHCNPSQRNFPLEKGKIPPWWPTCTDNWWQNIPMLASVETPPYRKPHDLKKTWKVGVLLAVIKHMAPNFGIIKSLVRKSRSLKDKMTPKEIFLWNTGLTHERRLYITLKNDKNLATSRSMDYYSNSVDGNASTANNQAKASGMCKVDQIMGYIDEDTTILGSYNKRIKINENFSQTQIAHGQHGPQHLQFSSYSGLPNEVQQNDNFFPCPYSVSVADQNVTDQLQWNYNNNVSFIQHNDHNDQNPIQTTGDHVQIDSIYYQSQMDQDVLGPQAMTTVDQNVTDQLQLNYNNNVSFIQHKGHNDQTPIQAIGDHAQIDSIHYQSQMNQDALQLQAMTTANQNVTDQLQWNYNNNVSFIQNKGHNDQNHIQATGDHAQIDSIHYQSQMDQDVLQLQAMTTVNQDVTDQLQWNYNNNASFIQHKGHNDQNPIQATGDHVQIDSVQHQSQMDQDVLRPQAMTTAPDNASSSHEVMVPVWNCVGDHGLENNDDQELDDLFSAEIRDELMKILSS